MNEKQLGVPLVLGELINVLLRKGVISQEDLDQERAVTLDNWDEMQRISDELAEKRMAEKLKEVKKSNRPLH